MSANRRKAKLKAGGAAAPEHSLISADCRLYEIERYDQYRCNRGGGVGAVIYAIGDIHGEKAMLDEMHCRHGPWRFSQTPNSPNKAAEYVQRALKGAERHATRVGARPRNIAFTTTTCR
jgi:hypothetical protein